MKYSIIIPCYNEAENIPLILKRFDEVIKGYELEVILVNNGSTDNTDIVMKKLLPEYIFARSVYVPVNKGYGYGILQGLKAADREYIGWTHADMQTDPADVIKAINIIESLPEKNVYVKGNRKGRPVFDMLFTWGMSLFETVFFRTPMSDINAQPNLFPRDFYLSWKKPPHDFSLDLYAVYMAKRSGICVLRFPVLFPERIHGESKWNTEGIKSKWKFIKRTVAFSFDLKRRIPKNKERL